MADSNAPASFFPDLLEASPEEVAAANKEDGRTGSDRFLPYPEEVDRLDRAGDLTDAPVGTVLKLFLHPDERVNAFAFRKRGHSTYRRPQAEVDRIQEALQTLKTRALAVAEEHNWAWTGLMHSMGRGWRHIDVSPKRTRTQKRRLAPWIQAQNDPAALLELLSAFEGPDAELFELVAEHATVSDPELLWTILTGTYSRPVRALARNEEAVPPRARADLIDHAVAGIEEGESIPHLRRLLDEWVEAGKGPLTASQRVRLEAVATSPRASARASARKALMLMPDLASDRIRRLWDALKTNERYHMGQASEPFESHPNTPIEILRYLARENTTGTARIRLANNPTAIADGEIREHLTDSQGKRVLTELMKTASPERMQDMFDLLVRRNPEGAAELLGDDELPEDVELRREHLVRLLEYSDRDVRALAIGLVSRAQKR